jgi:flavin-dependent dehydrogenase
VIESRPQGWLFLTPAEHGYGWLLAVGDLGRDPLAGSRLLGSMVQRVTAHSGAFPVSPRLVVPLCGPGWLACGTAAMAFDPICGDGTALALRAAILAAAVVRAALAGEPAPALLDHYASRLNAAFDRHLVLCRQFYSDGFGGEWWERQAASLELEFRPEPRATYRLQDFGLRRAG